MARNKYKWKILLLLIIFMGAVGLGGVAVAGGSAQEDEEGTSEQKTSIKAQYDEEIAKDLELWKLELEIKRKRWEARSKAIRQIWGEVHEPGKKDWVIYSDDNNSYSHVDFKDGVIEVAAVSEDTGPKARKALEEDIATRLLSILLEEAEPGKKILSDQVAVPGKNRPITDKEIDNVVTEALRDLTKPTAFVGQDGRSRIKQTIRLDLLPKHLEKRASLYMPAVERCSEKYGVEPDLILAVMEAESYFNPRAVSHAGAYGLMQLVPDSGGAEAAKMVYGVPKIPEPSELYDPETNIELGTAYLSILRDHYFMRHTKDPEKLSYLMIAGYNCGPSRVRNILKGRDLRRMSARDLYKHLKKHVPGETKGYLDGVTRRREHYRAAIG